jgi:hypothetical protein
MNSYASTLINIQTSARQREAELRERELIARNAAILAARAADGEGELVALRPAGAPTRGGMIGALLRVVGRPASAH